MIFKDEHAHQDFEDRPAIGRSGRCLNCGDTRGYHYGWRCPSSTSRYSSFAAMKPTERFETKAMRDSLKKLDTDNWRAWKYAHPGHCVCGIARERCVYHR